MLRILTENKHKSDIQAELISRGFDCTILEGYGTWDGEREYSLVIEIEGSTLPKVCEVAEAIRKMNNQQAVLVQSIPSELYTITEEGRKCLTI